VFCPNCESGRVRCIGEIPAPVEMSSAQFASVRDYAQALLPSNLVTCFSCALIFRSPQPAVEQLNEFYSKLPAKNWNYELGSVGSWAHAKHQLGRLYRATDPIDIVDVGAFNGTFLESLPVVWVKHAVEPNESAVAELKRKSINHIAEFLSDVKIRERSGSFDVVTMFDVFEHMLHPDDVMERLLALLKPGGRLLISTGNADHWSWQLLGPRHWYLHTIQHLCVGSKKYFSAYCQRHRLMLESCQHHSHRTSSICERLIQGIETLHWWSLRKTGLCGLPARVIQRLPRFRYLLHKTASPFATGLADHILVVIRKPSGVDNLEERAVSGP
jgi:SAM-dependent methyltransferase